MGKGYFRDFDQFANDMNDLSEQVFDLMEDRDCDLYQPHGLKEAIKSNTDDMVAGIMLNNPMEGSELAGYSKSEDAAAKIIILILDTANREGWAIGDAVLDKLKSLEKE